MVMIIISVFMMAGFGALFWGLIFRFWAPKYGQIENVTFGQSFAVAFIGGVLGSALYGTLVAVMVGNPEDFLKIFSKMGIVLPMLMFIGAIGGGFTIGAKLIWKSGIVQSFKATSIATFVYAAMMGVGGLMTI
jgi:hypothetical protein